MSKVIAAMQSGQLPMPTTEPAANPQALTEEMVEAAGKAIAESLFDMSEASGSHKFIKARLSANVMLRERSNIAGRAALTAALSLTRPAADRGQIEACPFCGGDELNLADNEYRSRAIARLNSIARGQIVEECARMAEHLNGWGTTPNPALAAHIARCIRLLSPAPAQTEE